ncbi:MAG: acylneuraminate cytidylyltransferase family protein [Flavobacteriaceae bacterium]
MNILGLIPARGGSKGIPNKNRKELNGKPLLQYTIEAALGSKRLSKVVFSSEDEQLMTLASHFGAEVPFVRPPQLATDSAGSLEVVQHALQFYAGKGTHFDAVCLLQVTYPFRTSKDIDEALKKFIETGTDSLISVQEIPHQYNPHWAFVEKEKNMLSLATGEKTIISRRQDLPKAYIRDGAFYVTKAEVLLQHHSFYGNSISYITLDPSKHVNIDTPTDWQKAEEILKNATFGTYGK